MNNIINMLFSELDLLSNEYEGLSDTDVREALYLTLNYFFVWGRTGKIPSTYCMYSVNGDQSVAKIINDFLSNINNSPEIAKVPLGQPRLDLLQDSKILTPHNRRYYDFIGYENKLSFQENLPAFLFEEGDYDD